jgi:TolB protein
MATDMSTTPPTQTLNRRKALQLSLAAGAAGLAAMPAARAQPAPRRSGPLEVDIDQANLRPRPIAVSPFISDDLRLGQDIARVIEADLESSALFQPLDPRAFIERIGNIDVQPRYNDWKSIGAEALVVGRVTRLQDGRIRAEFRIYDVLLGKPVAGQQFTTSAANWRRIGHIIADQAWEKFTLEKGYFDTRVVFVDETGPKDRRVKRLAIMDQDGANVRLLSQGQELVLTPRFSPSSQEITYMSYTRDQPRVVLMNIETGKREVVGDFPGMTFAPRFSPEGQRIVMSAGQGGNSALLEMDLRSRQMRRLTDGQGIDTGPCYSPDARQIVFESDRGGNQQLYVMAADGASPRRISAGEGRYSTPVWSPRGDYIAYTKQLSGRFLIGVMKVDGSGERILTDGFHNEGPTWAPNGRFLMFFRESPGAGGGPRLFSVDLTARNERVVKTPAFASDPAWSPLLK